MAHKDSQSKHTFARHVAPFAPIVLALGMQGVKPGQAASTTQPNVNADAFVPVCTLPFNGASVPAIDGRCSMQGGSTDPAKQAESEAKNDFCEATNAPQLLLHQDFVDLQTRATNANLRKSIPDRKVLEGMGEGKYVTYIAMIKDAHYSDVAAGEAVNCNIPGNDTNDIHIVLMADPNDSDECHSTTAEMSPHHRPLSWTPENLKSLGPRPVRLRGHLFYDGSHSPCTATSRPNPKRASLWEIHPIYSLDVCNLETLAECRNAGESDWIPLEKWLSSEAANE
jgi:hypothetical protein